MLLFTKTKGERGGEIWRERGRERENERERERMRFDLLLLKKRGKHIDA